MCNWAAQAGLRVSRKQQYNGLPRGISCRPGTPSSFFSKTIDLHHTVAEGKHSLYPICNPKYGFTTTGNIKSAIAIRLGTALSSWDEEAWGSPSRLDIGIEQSRDDCLCVSAVFFGLL
jgi:hypothetical protein